MRHTQPHLDQAHRNIFIFIVISLFCNYFFVIFFLVTLIRCFAPHRFTIGYDNLILTQFNVFECGIAAWRRRKNNHFYM